MKTYKSVVLIACVSFMVAACSPDLAVTTLETTGPATVNPANSVEVPIRVVVKNQGSAAADIFKVATEYTGSRGTYVVAFTVPGQSDIWYPYTNTSLGAGSEVAFAGKVIFHPAIHGEAVTLKAVADSCSGDEFMPDHCRVKESNEGNNESAAVSVLLP
jgi:subtilase family serine protease